MTLLDPLPRLPGLPPLPRLPNAPEASALRRDRLDLLIARRIAVRAAQADARDLDAFGTLTSMASGLVAFALAMVWRDWGWSLTLAGAVFCGLNVAFIVCVVWPHRARAMAEIDRKWPLP